MLLARVIAAKGVEALVHEAESLLSPVRAGVVAGEVGVDHRGELLACGVADHGDQPARAVGQEAEGVDGGQAAQARAEPAGVLRSSGDEKRQTHAQKQCRHEQRRRRQHQLTHEDVRGRVAVAPADEPLWRRADFA